MKRTIKISSLFLYILFTQVYTVVHWHAQEHQGDAELYLSIHPPEVLLDNFDHDDHHDKSDQHEHEDIHLMLIGSIDFKLKNLIHQLQLQLFRILNH